MKETPGVSTGLILQVQDKANEAQPEVLVGITGSDLNQAAQLRPHSAVVLRGVLDLPGQTSYLAFSTTLWQKA